MVNFIKSLLSGMKVDFTVDELGNIYATKGQSETYPCIVCHTDEVHDFRGEGYCVVQTNDLMFGLNERTKSLEGIGADDKNGIWVCIHALNDFDVMKCAFFVSEEVGCIGSSGADMKFFDDCRFVLQCDRRGNKDFIIDASGVELCSAEFIEACGIGNFGYEVAHGMMTDVMTLKQQGLAVCAANLSCGYYNPHTEQEMTCISDLRRCYSLVCYIVKTCTDVYPHEYVWESVYDDWNRYGKEGFGDCEFKSYYKEYEDMANKMYEYAYEGNEADFSLNAFIAMYGSNWKTLDRTDYEFACEDLMGCIMH